MGVSSLNFFIALGDNGWKKVTSYSLLGIAWFKLNADSVVTLESPQGVSHTSLWPGSVMAFDTKWMTSDGQVKTKNIKEENTIVRICWSICNFYLCIGKNPLSLKAISRWLHFLAFKIHPNLASSRLGVFPICAIYLYVTCTSLLLICCKSCICPLLLPCSISPVLTFILQSSAVLLCNYSPLVAEHNIFLPWCNSVGLDSVRTSESFTLASLWQPKNQFLTEAA